MEYDVFSASNLKKCLNNFSPSLSPSQDDLQKLSTFINDTISDTIRFHGKDLPKNTTLSSLLPCAIQGWTFLLYNSIQAKNQGGLPYLKEALKSLINEENLDQNDIRSPQGRNIVMQLTLFRPQQPDKTLNKDLIKIISEFSLIPDHSQDFENETFWDYIAQNQSNLTTFIDAIIEKHPTFFSDFSEEHLERIKSYQTTNSHYVFHLSLAHRQKQSLKDSLQGLQFPFSTKPHRI